jgi:hypothetical protein
MISLELGTKTYLLIYTLIQGERVTQRSTLWRSTELEGFVPPRYYRDIDSSDLIHPIGFRRYSCKLTKLFAQMAMATKSAV